MFSLIQLIIVNSLMHAIYIITIANIKIIMDMFILKHFIACAWRKLLFFQISD